MKTGILVFVAATIAATISYYSGHQAGATETRKEYLQEQKKHHADGPWAEKTNSLQLSPTETVQEIMIRDKKMGAFFDTQCLLYNNTETKAAIMKCANHD